MKRGGGGTLVNQIIVEDATSKYPIRNDGK